ncbi:MAG: response regulator [Myxococcales bacterium]|nr:response regulator [Myxococcales bacterium]
MSHTPKLLLVDDNRDILASLRRTLRRCGFELTCIDLPALAIEALERETFDLMLCDIDMPVLNGHEVMSKARELQPAMVRVFVTGAGNMDAAVRAINEGEVHRFVRKPFDANNLRNMIREALDRKDEIELVAEASTRVRRRRQLYEQLEAEHPGITEVSFDSEGAYEVDTARARDVAGPLGFGAFVTATT